MEPADKKLQELQILEQSLQSLMIQKQAFQMELAETEASLKELEKSGDETFKIIGQLMLRKDKTEIKKEMQDKKKILETQIKNLDKQEVPLAEELEKLRQDFLKSMKK